MLGCSRRLMLKSSNEILLEKGLGRMCSSKFVVHLIDFMPDPFLFFLLRSVYS